MLHLICVQIGDSDRKICCFFKYKYLKRIKDFFFFFFFLKSLYNLHQERLHRSSVQMNGGSYHSPNTGLHPPVPHHPSAQGFNSHPNATPASNQSTISPYVPASRLSNPQDTQQSLTLGPVKLACKQCQKQFSSKPEVLQFKVEIAHQVMHLFFVLCKICI